MSKTIVEALKNLHLAFGGNAEDTANAKTTVEVIDEITKVVDGQVLKLKVVPVTDNTDLFGKTANDLQSNIKLNKNSITGTLAYVSDYTGFSSNPAEQSGNYIALKATANIDGATITGEVVGGTKGAVTLDSDGIIVCKIANNTQSIRFVASINGKTASVEYALTDLTLEAEPQPTSCQITFNVLNENFDSELTVDIQPEEKVIGAMGEETQFICEVLDGEFTYTASAVGYTSQSGTINVNVGDTSKLIEITFIPE